MKIEQIYTGCIAHAAYYIENKGEAAIFDPLRDVIPYMEKAKNDHATIKYVFETHFHADFVSGHLDLAQKTNAKIVYGPTAKPGFEAILAKDNQEFKVGGYTVKVIHTPGHTMESTTYLLIDETGKEHGIISGDTLFIGDVGRPDLAQHVIPGLTEEILAGHLYDSLRNKIMPLNDDLIVYPNHGAGSACGKMMSKETTDTLGNQKRTNYALNPELSKKEFIRVLLDGLMPPPAYFPKNVLLNINGYENLDSVLLKGYTAIPANEFKDFIDNKEVLILDCRDSETFAKGFIPSSLNIGLESNFAMWAGELIPDINHKIALVCPKEKEKEALIRLSRIGFDNSIGYLEGGFDEWAKEKRPIEKSIRITAQELFERLKNPKTLVIDVRKKSEFESEHVAGAINIPLNQLENRINEIPKKEPFILHCAGGYRSMIASSILKKHEITNFVDVIGGITEISTTDISLTDYVCPTTLL
jgi:rhodanese-related sulfurtransferase/glyoxylase-like metal-dependent hydrolase (beta-lactamase superfamily II)